MKCNFIKHYTEMLKTTQLVEVRRRYRMNWFRHLQNKIQITVAKNFCKD